MRVDLLGPVEVTEGDVRTAVHGVKERLVLARLALDANRFVPE
jgi:DNA-binding SARP family transcriptional activator